MTPNRTFFLFLAVGAAILIGSIRLSAPERQRPEVENLRAFAKLYGYVRYFHPSDEASAIDWDKFAVHGVLRVKSAQGREELRQAMEALFLPIAPTLQIYPSEQAAPPLSPQLLPSDTTGLKLIAWQHLGVGFGNANNLYRSNRLNRESTLSDPTMFGFLAQTVDAAPYRGKEIKLLASAKADVNGLGNQVQLWMSVERPNQQMGFFDNMGDRPITSSEWSTYEISGTVAKDALGITFGGFLLGKGKGWLDDFQMLVKNGSDTWTAVPLRNAGFEQEETGAAPSDWRTGGPGYRFATTPDEAHEGRHAALIALESDTPVIQDALFSGHPEPGDVLDKPLGAGLSVQLPLALYSRDGHTIGEHDRHAPDELTSILDSIDVSTLTAEDESLRLADVVIAWNVLQHFYPYFDVVETDWNAVLTSTLTDALDDSGTRDFLLTLRRMVAQLDDGHGGVYHATQRGEAGLPFLVDWIEDRMVVVATADSSLFQVGDVVLSIDGVPSEEALRQSEFYLSGSPQWKRSLALRQFERGTYGTQVRLEILREDERMERSVPRNFNQPIREPRPANVQEIEDGIFYVNLDQAEMAEINERTDELAGAKGIIFDLRGYPNGNHDVLTHLTDEPLRSAHWQVPQIVYPDRENLVGYDTTGRWYMEPMEPRFGGVIVFLTDGRAISYAESVMGIVEHYRLGEIVGQPTAGTNGNINPFVLPGGFDVRFTGMRVLKHDGSQHHLVGIQPTFPVERTLEGVRSGRDEYLERGIELIKSRAGS